MIPRYTPDLHPGLLPALLPRAHEAARRDFLDALIPDRRYDYVFDRLRTGLYAYFRDLRERTQADAILMSAQICPLVPELVRATGFVPRFVDLTPEDPTPSPRQFVEALSGDTAALLLAPLYGHLPGDWSELLSELGERRLVLDLAQGLGLEARVEALVRAADAVAYSFGIGKGLDCGGGLLLMRSALASKNLPPVGAGAVISAWLQGLALRGAIAVGVYGWLAVRVDRVASGPRFDPRAGRIVPQSMYNILSKQLARFQGQVEIARLRAADIGQDPAVAPLLKDPDRCCDPEATHLRQLIRLPSRQKRDEVLQELRALGIDCAGAGEPLPGRPADFPNAEMFRNEAIRLPFLGRLSESQYTQLKLALRGCESIVI